MHIRIIAVGKVKEPYLAGGIAEYMKRLAPLARVEIVEVPDERLPDQPAPALEEAVRKREADKILASLKPGTRVVALAIQGKMFSSEGLAGWLQDMALAGQSDLTFIIGGTLGLSPEVLSRADLLLSLSPMTFPHQLTRLILLEQLYRAFKITRGEPYHR